MGSKKRRRRSRQKAAGEKALHSAVQPSHQTNGRQEPPEAISEAPSKAGPSQEFIQELIDAQSGHAKRWRNIGDSPLTLAYYRGQLEGNGDSPDGITAADRHSAGQRFAKLWEQRFRSGNYAFEGNLGGAGDPHWWNDHIAHASHAVHRMGERMYFKNFLIVMRFCGEGRSMTDALRGVVECHHSSVPQRIREALDDLVTAMTGRRQQPSAPPPAAREMVVRRL